MMTVQCKHVAKFNQVVQSSNPIRAKNQNPNSKLVCMIRQGLHQFAHNYLAIKASYKGSRVDHKIRGGCGVIKLTELPAECCQDLQYPHAQVDVSSCQCDYKWHESTCNSSPHLETQSL